MCVKFAYHSTGILAILDFQDSLNLSLDEDLLEMHIKLSFLAHWKHKCILLGSCTVSVCVYLFQASLSSSLEVFALSKLRGW